jgi:hypothetical protein
MSAGSLCIDLLMDSLAWVVTAPFAADMKDTGTDVARLAANICLPTTITLEFIPMLVLSKELFLFGCKP